MLLPPLFATFFIVVVVGILPLFVGPILGRHANAVVHSSNSSLLPSSHADDQHQHHRRWHCPPRCSCSHSTVICAGLGLTSVPEGIPMDTIRLDLQENQIQQLSAHDFAGLDQLRVLLLTDNLIESIEADALHPLTRLERLKLNRNHLHSIPSGVFARNRHLRRLDLSENGLLSLSTDQLRGPERLHSLQLDRNRLHCLDSLALAQWPTLESISLSSNALTTLAQLDLTTLPHLRNLRLSDNPWHCDCRLKWLKRLKIANQIRCHRPSMLFGRSLDTISLKQLKCSGLEKRASQRNGAGGGRSCRHLDWCPAGCQCTEASAATPQQLVVDCHDRLLRTIPANLPPNTVELRLEQNRITHLPNHSFAHLHRLVRLDLSKNAIAHVDADAFAGLSRLTSIMLFANNLTDLPVGVFSGMPALQVLLLNGNQLRCIRNGALHGLRQLRLLSLYDNHIRSIAESAFQPFAHSLQTLHLARNPLICDCNMHWLAQMLAARPIETSGARCHSPRRVARRRLATLAPRQFRCADEWERLVTEGAGHCRVDHECPKPCRCNGTTVDCRGQELRAAPADGIPLFATSLLLGRNRIEELPATLFAESLPNLHFLELSNNRLTDFPANSLAGLVALRELDIRNNTFTRLNTMAFGTAALAAGTLQTIRADGNAFRCFPVQQFPALRHLTLRHNPLLHSLGGIGTAAAKSKNDNIFEQQLEHVELDNQQWICDCRLRPLVRILRKMWAAEANGSSGRGRTTMMENAGTEQQQQQMEMSPQCAEPPHLRGRPLLTLDEEHDLPCQKDENYGDDENDDGDGGQCMDGGDFCPSGCVCTNQLEQQHDRRRHVAIAAAVAPPPPLLVVRCSNRSLTTVPFGLPSNTGELLLDHNRIEHIAPEDFFGLPQLTKLDLSYNGIQQIAAHTFAPLPTLRILILARNHIRCLSPNAFAGVGQLRVLSLHSNQLAQLPETAFAPLVANLSHLSLHGNPFWCDCQMNWAGRWLRSKFVEAGIARCEGPPERRLQLLISAQPAVPCPASAPAPHWVLAKCRPCLAEPCQHAGMCRALTDGEFRCECATGWAGQLCENPTLKQKEEEEGERTDLLKVPSASFGNGCATNASNPCLHGRNGTENNNDDCVNSNKCIATTMATTANATIVAPEMPETEEQEELAAQREKKERIKRGKMKLMRRRRRCAKQEKHQQQHSNNAAAQVWTVDGIQCRSKLLVPSCSGQCDDVAGDDNDDGDNNNQNPNEYVNVPQQQDAETQKHHRELQQQPKPNYCCAPTRVRRRRIQLYCLDGRERWTVVEVPRRCECRRWRRMRRTTEGRRSVAMQIRMGDNDGDDWRHWHQPEDVVDGCAAE